MTPQCRSVVAKVLGKEPTDGQVDDIESRLSRNMRQLAMSDPQAWHGKSPADRAAEAAQLAAAELKGEAQQKVRQAALKVVATAREETNLAELRKSSKTTAGALVTQMEQVYRYAKGTSQEYFSRIVDAIESIDKKFFGLAHDDASVRDFTREVLGEDSGNAAAKKGAKVWLDTIESMRQRFNRAGGDVRKLDYGYLPQPADAARVRKLDADAFAAKVLPLLDRKRYLNDDGTRMTDAQIVDTLKAAHTTLATDGLNKLEPGKFAGSGAKANRGQDARVLHFASADAYLAYMNEFGRGNTFQAMQSHIAGMSRDIALVERFGPNPTALFQRLSDTAVKADGGVKLVGPLAVTAKNVWDVLSGYTGQRQHATLADLAQGVRNLEVASKLGSAFLASATDIPTMLLTAHYNRLPLFDTLAAGFKSIGKGYRDDANRMGLVAESMMSDMNRWAEGNLGQNWTSKVADTVLKASLLTGWTDALRRGFSVTMMGSLGKMTRKDWGSLKADDLARLQRSGITEQDWKVYQSATPEDWRGSQMLTPEAVRAVTGADIGHVDAAVSRLLGFIADEGETAILGQDLQTRAALTRGTQKGTVEGEILRSVALFKGYPLAMVSRHLSRMSQQGLSGGAAYGAQLILGLTTFGAMSLLLKDVANGKDPRDMTTGKFWATAFQQGGGLGIYGDLLYTGLGLDPVSGQSGSAKLLQNLAGPVFGTIGDVSNVFNSEHHGAAAVRFVKSNIPGMNLWYAKAGLDHLFFHQLQEDLSPGYLARMRSRTIAQGGSYWWQPNADAPTRPPNMLAAVGEAQ